jgi:hypothetical protein
MSRNIMFVLYIIITNFYISITYKTAFPAVPQAAECTERPTVPEQTHYRHRATVSDERR